jgi:hypothetical protein
MHLLGVHRCRSARRVASRCPACCAGAHRRTSPPAALTLVFGDVACVVRPSADVECGCDVHVVREITRVCKLTFSLRKTFFSQREKLKFCFVCAARSVVEG